MSSNIRIKRICEHCNKEFIAKTTVTRFCGDHCSKRNYKLRKKKAKIEESNKETIAIMKKPILELQSKEFLSLKDASSILNVSRTTLWRLIKTNRLKATKIGNRVIIKKATLNELFQ